MNLYRYMAVCNDGETYDIYPVRTFADDNENWSDHEVTALWTKEKFTPRSVVCAVRLNVTDFNTDEEQEFCFASADNDRERCFKKAEKQMSKMCNIKVSVSRPDNSLVKWDTDIDTTKLKGHDNDRSFRFIVEFIRGVVCRHPRGDKEPVPFKYRWCLPFDRKSRQAVTEMVVKKVEFDISRYGEHTETLTFHKPVSRAFAISAVEEYLSEPLDPDYYNRIRDDLFMGDIEWSQASAAYDNRGSCLTDCMFLESFDESKEEKGLFVIFCGS
jgi:hypothetical protein